MAHVYRWLRDHPSGKAEVIEDHFTMETVAKKKARNRRRNKVAKASRKMNRP